MDFNSDIDKQIGQYFDGSINNVDKDLIDILAMTDSSVAKKFNAYKHKYFNPAPNQSTISWKLPVSIGLVACLSLFFVWNNSFKTDVKKNKIIVEETSTDVPSITNSSNENTEVNTETITNEPTNTIVPNVDLKQEVIVSKPQIIFTPAATPEKFELIELEKKTSKLNGVETTNKESVKNRLPKLRKGKRPTVVPIEDSGF